MRDILKKKKKKFFLFLLKSCSQYLRYDSSKNLRKLEKIFSTINSKKLESFRRYFRPSIADLSVVTLSLHGHNTRLILNICSNSFDSYTQSYPWRTEALKKAINWKHWLNLNLEEHIRHIFKFDHLFYHFYHYLTVQTRILTEKLKLQMKKS